MSLEALNSPTIAEAADGPDHNLEMAPKALNSATAVAAEEVDHNLEMAPEALNSATAAAAEDVDHNLEMASEALNSETAAAAEGVNHNLEMAPEAPNSATEAAAEGVDHNLEMAPVALNSATTAPAEGAVHNLEMAPETLNSAAAAEEDATPPSPLGFVDTFGPLTKKPRSKRPRYVTPETEEEHLANCIDLLDRSTESITTTTVPTATAINNKKEPYFLEPQNRSYECSACNKTFQSYQTLGGHEASHRNKPTENNIPSTSAAPGNASTLNPSSRAHVCSVCDKSFTTGQALGGHKRLHYERQTSRPCGGRDDTKPIVHDFDLNLPAKPESEFELGLNVDSEMKNEIYSDHEVDQDPVPTKKLCLAIN